MKGSETMERNWKRWIKKAGIRAIKTMAQTFVATVGTAMVMSDVKWGYVFSASILAGILSLATSLAGIPEENVGGLNE